MDKPKNSIGIKDLGDVSFTDPIIPNQVVKYDGAKWTNQTDVGSGTLAGLSDTNINVLNPLANNQMLKYNITLGQWFNTDIINDMKIYDVNCRFTSPTALDRQAVFNLDNLGPATLATMRLPNDQGTGDIELVGTNNVQILTGKKMTDPTNNLNARALWCAGSTAIVSVVNSPAPTAGQVLKAIDPGTAEWRDEDPAPTTYNDDTFRIQDETDNSKKIAFEAGTITTGNTRTYTGPDASGVLVLEDARQFLTNKNISDALVIGDNSNPGSATILEVKSTSKFSTFAPVMTDAQASIVPFIFNSQSYFSADRDQYLTLSAGGFQPLHRPKWGSQYLSTQAETNIGMVGTWYKVAGVFTDGNFSVEMGSNGTSNLIQNQTSIARTFKCDASITAVTATGNKDCCFAFAINDGLTSSVLTDSEHCEELSTNKNNNIGLTTIATIPSFHALEVWVKNTSDTTNITAVNLTFNISTCD
jgi:hypothetical protein